MSEMPLLSPAPKAQPITASEMRAIINKAYPSGEYAVLYEVRDATGFSAQPRSADAVIMSCWPSRGLELHGVEVKVSRSDWMRERANPKKAERIAAYCDRWWLFTGPGVVHDISEIPPAWGWREWDGKVLRTRREAAKTEATPIDRAFLASLMRSAANVGEGIIATAQRELRKTFDSEIERAVERRLASRTTDKMQALMAQVQAFEQATGISLAHEETWGSLTVANGARVGDMVTAIRAGSLGEDWRGVASVHTRLLEVAEEVAKIGDAFGIVVERPAAKKKAARRK